MTSCVVTLLAAIPSLHAIALSTVVSEMVTDVELAVTAVPPSVQVGSAVPSVVKRRVAPSVVVATVTLTLPVPLVGDTVGGVTGTYLMDTC